MTPSTTPNQPPVIVAGAHLAALGTVRLLARRGIPTYVIDETTNIIRSSRFYRPTVPTLAETSDAATLAAALRAVDLPSAVLIPCSDSWTLAAAGLPDDLRARFPTSLSSAEAIAQLVDKDAFRDLTDRLDLPRPWSIIVKDPSDLDQATDEQLRHGFLKPTDSQAHNRWLGTKGSFVRSRDEARRLVAEASTHGVTYLLQEWVPGPPSATVILDGFVDRDGRIAGLGARRRVRMHPPRLSNTCCDVTIRPEEVEGAVRTIRRLLEALDYRGIFMAEFKHDERDGEFKIIEINPRPFWLVSHIAAAGLDLPYLAYLDAQGLPVPDIGAYRPGRYGMYEVVDAKAVAAAWRRGRPAGGSVLRPWLNGDRALFWFSDPMPAVHQLRQAVVSRRSAARRLIELAEPQETPAGT
jgi:predicted ATP-grasp superfamily ATP-dependent carboligase